jgi:hypothetical protein
LPLSWALRHDQRFPAHFITSEHFVSAPVKNLEIGKGPARAEVSINLSQKLQQMQLNNQ